MRIICSGAIAKYGHNPGSLEGLMAYVLGFQRLGHDVCLIEEVEQKQCITDDYREVPFTEWIGRDRFEQATRSFDIWPRSCLIYDRGRMTHGMSFSDLAQFAKDADVVLAVGGRIRTPEILDTPARKAYLDGNPGKTQVYHDVHHVDYGFDRFDAFFTVGLNIGTADCDLPTCGVQWHGLAPILILDMWPAQIDERCARFTTVSSWDGRHTIEWKGRLAGEKSDNWRRYVELPGRTSQPLEVAMAFDPVEDVDARNCFVRNGWFLSDPAELRTFEDLRNYYAQSRGEFSIAHDRYVAFNTGWFSERTARYLALGKPALVQSTGIEHHLPTGKGLLTFRTMEEAVEGIESINSDYLTHCYAARAIAEEFFDADKTLTRMLSEIGA